MISLSEQIDRARIVVEEIDDALERRFPGLRAEAESRLSALEAQAARLRPTPEIIIDDRQMDVEEYLATLAPKP